MKIAMVTVGYPPDQVGGTETYVAGLVDELHALGHGCSVIHGVHIADIPGTDDIRLSRRDHAGTAVTTVEVSRAAHHNERFFLDTRLQQRILAAYLDCIAATAPDIVHVHPLGLAFDSRVIETLSDAGYPVVLTFHTATSTCSRGDLLYMGDEVCDGRVIQSRCTRCNLCARGVPAPLADLASRVPVAAVRAAFMGLRPLDRFATASRVRSAAAIPLMVTERKAAYGRVSEHADRVVAVCDWAGELLVANGIPVELVRRSRHGHRLAGAARAAPQQGRARFGYLGRITAVKGIAVLLDALARLPGVDFSFEFTSPSFTRAERLGDEHRLTSAVEELARQDPRVSITPSVGTDAGAIAEVLSRWDALVVPSLWMETGPLVIHEAFAVGTPVIGSRRGGIAELVEHGRTGLLVTPADASELADTLRAAAANPAGLRGMRDNIGPGRTMADVAREMTELYHDVLAERSRPRAS